MRRALALWAVLVLLAACAREPAAPLPQEAYVWQRQWTPALTEAVREQSAAFAGLRVLALQQLDDRQVRPAPDLDALRARGLPLRPVLRMEGSRPRGDPQALATAMAGIARDWRGAGLRVEGIEVDHDCASAGLAEYTAWLQAFRAGLADREPVSITALPSWLQARQALAALRAAVDESVLQVHALDASRLALIDVKQSLRWARAWSAQAAQPFRIALPAYSLRVSLARSGQVRAVDAEGSLDLGGSGARDRHADPAEVVLLVRELQQNPPPGLSGLVWFRLPVSGDRRSWSTSTLAAVMQGQAPQARFELRANDRGSGLYDLVLRNVSELDGFAPRSIKLPDHCGLLEGLGAYRNQEGKQALLAADRPWLRAGAVLAIGFARCELQLPAATALASG